MSKVFFRFRHAALASAMALLMGAPLAFADAAIDPGAVNPPTVDAPAPIALDPTPVTAGGAVVEPVVDSGVVVEPVVDGGAVVEPVVDGGVVVEPVVDGGVVVEPVVDGGAVVEPVVDSGDAAVTDGPAEAPAPIDDGGLVVADPLPADGGSDEPTPPSADGGVAGSPPADDCGMMCWNMAGNPGTEVYKGEEAPGTIVEFHAVGDNFRGNEGTDVSADLSGAIGVAEQLGAADNALDADTSVATEPLASQPSTIEVASAASAKNGNLIRNGHLR